MGRGRNKKKDYCNEENNLRDCVELVLEEAPEHEAAEPQIEEPVLYLYKVQVTHPSLRKRAEPDTGSEILGYITDQGVYDIYAEINGWGQIYDKSWIMLQFTQKIK